MLQRVSVLILFLLASCSAFAQVTIYNPTYTGQAQSSMNMGGYALTNIAAGSFPTNALPSVVTLQGNTFNSTNNLVQLDGTATLTLPSTLNVPHGAVQIGTNSGYGNTLVFNSGTNQGTGDGSGIIVSRAAGNERWAIAFGSVGESGSNTGTPFAINRYTDAGGYIGTPLYIVRSNGHVILGSTTDDGTDVLQVAGSAILGGSLNLSNNAITNIATNSLALNALAHTGATSGQILAYNGTSIVLTNASYADQDYAVLTNTQTFTAPNTFSQGFAATGSGIGISASQSAFIATTQPTMVYSSAVTNQRIWDQIIYDSNGTLRYRVLNDNESAANDWLESYRAGYTPTYAAFPYSLSVGTNGWDSSSQLYVNGVATVYSPGSTNASNGSSGALTVSGDAYFSVAPPSSNATAILLSSSGNNDAGGPGVLIGNNGGIAWGVALYANGSVFTITDPDAEGNEFAIYNDYGTGLITDGGFAYDRGSLVVGTNTQDGTSSTLQVHGVERIDVTGANPQLALNDTSNANGAYISLQVNGAEQGKIQSDIYGDLTLSAGGGCKLYSEHSSSSIGINYYGRVVVGPSTYNDDGINTFQVGGSIKTTGAISTATQFNGAGTGITNLPSSAVIGTTSGGNASAGYIGEYVSATLPYTSPVSLTSGTSVNVTNISLTAGDWDITGNVVISPNSGTTTTVISGWISTNSATNPTAPNNGAQYLFAGTIAQNIQEFPVGTLRLSISSTTTVYLTAFSSFSGSTSTAYGFIGARRVR